MQDLRTAAWPVPYSGKLRPDSLGEDRGLGELANRSVLAQVSNSAETCPAIDRLLLMVTPRTLMLLTR